MKIKIIYFEAISNDPHKIGYIDFKVEYSNNKWEVFRNCVFYKKNNKKWISPGIIKREGNFMPRYERNPSFNKIMEPLLNEIENYIERKNIIISREDSIKA